MTIAPELLMPAGSLEKLEWAFRFGADAVYAGIPLLSLRARENEFSLEDLQLGIQKAKSLNKKFYITANIFARNLKIKAFTENLDQWARLQPDALIMSDPGLISIVRERYPDIPIHLSVQANCMNWRAVKFWQGIGVSRIILSRELRLTEIKEIRERVPDIELEAFVHGSICIAYSGRCLLSHYMSYRDANQGVCDNSCRYPYRVYGSCDDQANVEKEFFIEDLRQPGEFYQIDEDEHGTYIMNSKDLCLIEHLRELADAGVCSFKVEGRTKSVFYVAMISKIYRKAIDDMVSGKDFDRGLLDELEKLATRGYHKGLLFGAGDHNNQNYKPTARSNRSAFAGIIHKVLPGNRAIFEPRGKINVGETVELISPRATENAEILKIYTSDEKECTSASPGGQKHFEVVFSAAPEEQSLVLKA